MRLFYYFLIAIAAWIITGCSSDDDLSLDVANQSTSSAQQTRADLPTKSKSENNPNLITNWESQNEIKLNNSAAGTVHTPWASVVSSNLSADFCTDVKKADGWTMLFHTFNKDGLEQNLNYMVFYNYFTGFIKVFYYSYFHNDATSINWCLECANGTLIPNSILELNELFTPVEGEYGDNLTDGTNSGLRFNNYVKNQSLINGWNGFEFQISRYEEYPKNLALSIGAVNQTITKYEFNGTLETAIEGSIITESYSEKPAYTAIANLANDAATKGLNNLYNKHIDKETKGPKTIIGSIFSGALSLLKSTGVGSAISAGMKLFFGRSLFKKTTDDSEVHLTQKGTITATGQSTTILNSTIMAMRFNLYDIFDINKPAGAEVANPNLVMGDFKGLGVWTLEYTPIVYYNPVSRFVPTNVSYKSGTQESDIEGFAAYPDIVDYDLTVKLNPMIKQYVSSYSVDVDFVESDLFTETEHSSSKIELSQDYLMDNHLYYMNTHHERFVMKARLNNQKIDNNLRYFYEWDTPGNRRTIAMVTVKLNVNYNNSKFTVEETRAYKTESVLDDSNYFPPANSDRAVLINNFNPRIVSHTYQGSVPDYEP